MFAQLAGEVRSVSAFSFQWWHYHLNITDQDQSKDIPIKAEQSCSLGFSRTWRFQSVSWRPSWTELSPGVSFRISRTSSVTVLDVSAECRSLTSCMRPCVAVSHCFMWVLIFQTKIWRLMASVQNHAEPWSTWWTYPLELKDMNRSHII